MERSLRRVYWLHSEKKVPHRECALYFVGPHSKSRQEEEKEEREERKKEREERKKEEKEGGRFMKKAYHLDNAHNPKGAALALPDAEFNALSNGTNHVSLAPFV